MDNANNALTQLKAWLAQRDLPADGRLPSERELVEILGVPSYARPWPYLKIMVSYGVTLAREPLLVPNRSRNNPPYLILPTRPIPLRLCRPGW